MVSFVFLLACSGPPATDKPAALPFEPIDYCAEYDDPACDAVFEALPACELHPPGERLQLIPGCLDGFCVGDTYADAIDFLGEPETCTRSDGEEDVYWYCDWPDSTIGIKLSGHGSGGSQPDADQVAATATVRWSWDGATPAGLGTDISLRCWLEHYGAPEGVNWSAEELRGVWYDDRAFFVGNSYWEHDVRPPHGYVSHVSLYTAP